MVLRKPTEQDQRKLHSEVNQLVNQRFLLTTLAVTLFGAFTAWQIQSTGQSGSPLLWIGCLLHGVLFLLFLLAHFKSCMLRTITTYLDVTGASHWEADWREFRKESHIGYAKPQAMLFLVLGVLAAAIPTGMTAVLKRDLGPPEAIMLLVGTTILYVLFITGMSFFGWFDNEASVRRRWEDLDK